VSGNQQQSDPADCVPAVLFGVLWDTLNDIMGSAATATLVRRAAKHASIRSPGLDGLAITRERFDYRYAVPDSWQTGSDDGLASLRRLMLELQPLLIELTGRVVLHRLDSVPELKRCGLVRAEADRET
jgi:hypothetical protein